MALLIIAVAAFSSCATKQTPELVSSGSERESSLPWNKQEKWENQGQFAGLAEHQGRR